MEEKWSKIDPYSVGLKRATDCIDIVKDIIGRIQKETTGNSIIVVGSLIIDKSELPTCNIELGLPYYLFSGGLVRNGDAAEDILFVVVIGGGVYEGVNSELLLMLARIYYEIRPKQHEVGQFVSLCSETSHHQIENQSPQTTPRHQNQICFLQILTALLHYFGVVIFLC